MQITYSLGCSSVTGAPCFMVLSESSGFHHTAGGPILASIADLVLVKLQDFKPSQEKAFFGLGCPGGLSLCSFLCSQKALPLRTPTGGSCQNNLKQTLYIYYTKLANGMRLKVSGTILANKNKCQTPQGKKKTIKYAKNKQNITKLVVKGNIFSLHVHQKI